MLKVQKMLEPSTIETGIRFLRDEPDSTSDENYFFSIQFMNTLLQEQQVLAFIVAMHARNTLLNFLKEMVYRIKHCQNHKNWLNMAVRLIGVIIVVGDQCFFCEFQVYSQILQSAQEQKRVDLWIQQNRSKYEIRQRIQNEKIQQGKKQVLSQWQVIRDLLIRMWKIDKIPQNFDKRKMINVFISEYLLMANARTCIEQICFTWIKEITEKIQNERKENLCCRIHFKFGAESQSEKFGQSNNQEFKDYHWPLSNESIVNHLAKTVVSFLNTAGGIVFVGMKEDKDKMMTSKGIKFKAKEKISFLYFMHDDIMRRIFPKQPEEQRRALIKQDEKVVETPGRKQLKQIFQKDDYQYRINRYVYVDFLQVYDPDTLMYKKEEAADSYVVRIKVKIGNPCELYHIYNDMKVPEAYFREEKSVKKKSMVEFYQRFYGRIKNTKDTEIKAETHEMCRFHPKTYDPPRFR